MTFTRFFPIIFIILFFVSACAERAVIPDPVPPETPLMSQAARSWDRKDYASSQSLYERLSEQPGLPERQQLLIWQRLGISAFYNQDYETALPALGRWADIEPRAKQFWQWHNMYSLSLKKTVGHDIYYRYLCDLIRNSSNPFDLRKKAAQALTDFHFQQGRYPDAMSAMASFHTYADTLPRRLELEQDFRQYLDQFSLSDLEHASTLLDQDKLLFFPWNVFYWSLYSRQLEKNYDLWSSLRPKLGTLSRRGQFADQAPYIRQFEKWTQMLGMPDREIAILLPLSGQFSASGWKILRGAGIAQWNLLLQGNRLKVRVINTDDEDWLQQLKSMDSVIMAGGPVSRSAWEKITASGINNDIVFFTFLPSIDDEGISGWRFFTSPGDQVRAMINRSIYELGFTDFAIFYPEDDFGRTYAQIFWEEASRNGVRISGLQSYPPDEPERWNSLVASFLNIRNMSTPYKHPSPDFQAIFIPDSLSRVKGLIPQFFYFDQNQLVFMGPMLWSQAYSPDTIEQQFFSLSMTTGAWLDDNPSPAAVNLVSKLDETMQGKPDFWVALGYDFVKFAEGLENLPSPASYELINSQLAGSTNHSWSMAPISWDNQGRASQDLYVFQLSRSSMSLADMDYFNSLIQIREARKAQWMQLILERDQQSPEQND